VKEKVRVRGKVVWVGKKDYQGKPYWRVGLVPDGEQESIFLNVYTVDAPGEVKETVTVEVTQDALDKARSQSKPRETPVAAKSSETEDRIVRSVALKSAADAIQAIGHTDISVLSQNVLRLAAAFENYLTGETPF